jgi:succinate dehydrogenase/fumarate reductase flavoprotein subunit
LTSNQKELNIDDSADQFYQDTMQCSGRKEGSLTEKLIRTMSDGSKHAVEWIEASTKVKLSEVGQLGGHSAARTHRPKEGLAGASFISGLERAVLKYRDSGRLEILKGHRMTKLEPVVQGSSEDGGKWDVELEIQERGGDGGDGEKKQKVTLRAVAVVLATGGYGNDKDGPSSLLKEVAPHLMRLRSTNGAFTTGDGIKVARELG